MHLKKDLGFLSKAVLLLTAVVVAGSGDVIAKQQNPTGGIRVTVRVEGTAEPIPGAQVTLVGPLAAGATGPAAATPAALAASGPVIVSTPFGTTTGLTVTTATGTVFVASPGTAANAVTGTVPSAASAPSTALNTDAAGVALFEKLAPGRYSIRVQRDGYIAPTPPGAVIGFGLAIATGFAVVEAGQTGPAQVALQLAPGASISGRVRDAYGVPLPTARVFVGLLGYREGRKTLLNGTSTQPDGQGNYRIFPLGAGDYYIRLEPNVFIMTPSGPELRRVDAYYPGVSSIDQATMISVGAGQEVVGIDFDMPDSKTFKVSGTVLNAPARTLPNGQTDNSVPSFTFANADPRSPDPAGAPLLQNTRRGGEFEISLPVGYWDIFPVALVSAPVFPPPQGFVPTYATGRARVLITDRDIENVTITLRSYELKGKVAVVGATASANTLSAMRIGLVPKENIPSPLMGPARQSQSLSPGGEFGFTGLPPGRFGLQLSAIPAGFYLSDLRVGERSVIDDGVIHVEGENVGPVEVVLSRGGGTVEASIPSLPPQASGAGVRQLVLVPSGPRRQNSSLYRSAPLTIVRPSNTFADVPPGDYKVFAFPDLPVGGAEHDEDFMARHEKYGVPVKVVGGQVSKVDALWSLGQE